MDIRFKYFLKNFQLFFNITENDVGYLPDGEAPVLIERKTDDSFRSSHADINFSSVAWKEWKGVKIPFLFDNDQTKDIVTYSGNKAVINYDIVASVFYFLSGWNEIVSPGRDNYHRPIFRESAINKLSLQNTPVVNYYFDILYETIKHVKKAEIKKPLWDNHKFAVALTHDIDKCQSAWLEGSASELRKGRFLSVPVLLAKRFLKNKDEWFNFDEIINIEKKYNATSSFFFLSRRGKSSGLENADYNIERKHLYNTIEFLKRNGFDTEIHGSPGTHVNAQALKSEIEKVSPDSVWGNRFHFLLFDPIKSASVLEECGIKYDSTLGFPDYPCFRRATCYPFYLFNFEKNDISPVIEIPLTVMDVTLAHKKYLGLNHEKALLIIKNLADEVRKHGGVLTLLWHNTYFSDYKFKGWREVYTGILDYCKENDALLTNARTVYERVWSKA